MPVIKALNVNLPMHSERYVVGEEVFPNSTTNSLSVGRLLVTEIKDMSVEYEDSIHTFYGIYADRKLLKRIEYTPVSIEYEI